MPWLQLMAETPKSAIRAIEDALLEAGAVSVTLQEHVPNGQEEKPILEPAPGKTPLWDSARITGLFLADCDTEQVTTQLKNTLDPLPKLRWEQLEDKDWEREWMDNYHPIQCSGNLWICPSWKTPPDPSAINVLLDPGLAFGTGTHPTTFLCMQWLASQNLEGKSLIDYGCGSGILGIAALLLGANTAAGIDIDHQALTASRENVERNGLTKERFPVFLPRQYAATTQVDVLIANILAGPIVELAETLLSPIKTGGYICLSGIIDKQADSVINAYREHIDFDPIQQKEEWVRLSGRKKV